MTDNFLNLFCLATNITIEIQELELINNSNLTLEMDPSGDQ